MQTGSEEMEKILCKWSPKISSGSNTFIGGNVDFKKQKAKAKANNDSM